MGTRCSLALIGLFTLLTFAGCSQSKVSVEPAPLPDYSRQLGPGESALRLITNPARLPDLARAWENAQSSRAFVLNSMDQSLRWFRAPSSRQFFPFEGFTHEQAAASVVAMRDLITRATSAAEFRAELLRLFDVYESVGYNNEGVVLFTGYYAPIFNASTTRTDRFTAPLYKRPADLVTDPVTGEPRGRRMPDGSVAPYHTRREIERTNMFAGNELVWVEDDLAAYIIHVNGSARLRLPDGRSMYVGYAGKTDRPYTGLGRSMLDEGLIDPNRLSLRAIKDYYRRDPALVRTLMHRNENFVFFTEYDESVWPAGSLGVRVTEQATLATDKKIYPRGGVVLVDTQGVTVSGRKRDFLQFMLDQDTGGAIQAPGRADIYMGQGPTAEILAGGQFAEGRLYYFMLKPMHAPRYRLEGAGGNSSRATR